MFETSLDGGGGSIHTMSSSKSPSSSSSSKSPKSTRVKGLGLIEDAKLRAAGHFTDATQWNEVHIGDETYTVERALLFKAKINLDEITVNPAYEKRPYKTQCGLCKLYFEKTSVRYKVPNHRIIQLQRDWNILKEGARYQSGSFLYTTSEVCVFCAQRFSYVDDDQSLSPTKILIDTRRSHDDTIRESSSVDDNIMSKSKDTGTITISTKLERADITKEKGIRAYQSSVVDGMCAELAVTGLLARNEDVHVKLSMDHCKTHREVDPWWEIDLRRQRDVESLEFMISTGVQQKLYIYVMLLKKPLGFEDPFLDSVIKKAVAMKHFVVPESPVMKYEHISWALSAGSVGSVVRVQLRGINVLNIQNFCALQGDSFVPFDEDDLNATRNSYATLSMSMIKDAIADMMSPIQRRNRAFKNDEKKQPPLEFGVLKLSESIEERYTRIREWKEKVMQYMNYFEKDEIVALYHSLFHVSVQNTNIAGKFDAKKNNTKKWDDDFLWGDGIMEHYPRSDFTCFHERVRTVLRWMQTRSHPKLLGSLLTSPKFEEHANDPDEHVYLLTHALNAVEKLLIEEESRPKKDKKEGEVKGCSWGQFCIIMALFCKQQSHRIGSVVYNIGKDDSDVFSETHSDAGGADNKKGSKLLSEQRDDDMRLNSPGALNASQSLPNINEGSKATLSSPKKMTFKQAQLAFVSKRVINENKISFPKTLIKDFKQYMDSQTSETIKPTTADGAAKAADETRSSNDNDDPLNLCRVCSLCNLKLPRASVEIQVMWKHVIDLRKNWDPKLIPKSIEMMDQTISMFNLVRVCNFCSQFFDPDFQGGIAFPIRDSKSVKQMGTLASINSQKKTSTEIPFYDSRYPMSLQTGETSWQTRSLASRSRARLAVAAISTHENKHDE